MNLRELNELSDVELIRKAENSAREAEIILRRLRRRSTFFPVRDEEKLRAYMDADSAISMARIIQRILLQRTHYGISISTNS